MNNNIALTFKFSELIDLWKEFCHSHTLLYNYTCEEYKYMISSELELLEKVVDNKKELIDAIHELDLRRDELLLEIKKLNSDEDVNTSSELIALMNTTNNENLAKQLSGYNNLLLDIVEKIQDQNKTNQIYLNRAIISLQELKDKFKGKKEYKTYNFKGTTAVGANS